jgi:hypothetical protein
MTLIIALGNADQFIQLSDRRKSARGQEPNDEWNKASIVTCANGRFIFGFTGLAEIGNFRTYEWLLDAIHGCSPPDYSFPEILERLKEHATQTYRTMPAIQCLSRSDQRLSVIFSGYLDVCKPSLGMFGIMTNFQDFTARKEETEAWDHFETTYGAEHPAREGGFTIVQPIGVWGALNRQDMETLQLCLRQHKPAQYIIDKGIQIIRTAADRPQARGAIGKQVTAIWLPRDPRRDHETGYYSNKVSTTIPFPGHIIEISDEQRFPAPKLSISIQDATGTNMPIATPKVGRNAPCPCKSGRKYKHCHGQPIP